MSTLSDLQKHDVSRFVIENKKQQWSVEEWCAKASECVGRTVKPTYMGALLLAEKIEASGIEKAIPANNLVMDLSRVVEYIIDELEMKPPQWAREVVRRGMKK
jgi:hypothetical protein